MQYSWRCGVTGVSLCLPTARPAVNVRLAVPYLAPQLRLAIPYLAPQLPCGDDPGEEQGNTDQFNMQPFSINKEINKSVYLLQLELATSFGVVALGNGKKKFLRADRSP